MSTPGASLTAQKRTATAGIPFILVWFLIIFLVILAITKLKPPEPTPATALAIQFSAERALIHVRAIAATPHHLGSDANTEVRNYLLSQLSLLGLDPQVFDRIGVFQSRNGVSIGRIQDICGRLPGHANSGAIMLVAHYDSVPLAPGAADDGAAVAAILESLRALRAGPALKNDLIVLFTDGEEAGLLGAEAFASGHPWLKDLAIVMNFEARGNQGPSMLFETSPGNSLLIEAVAHSAPHPVGSSLFRALYKLLPNNTDFTVFREHDISGLNFAFGENLDAYHTRLDNIGGLSLASLEHHGSYMLSLTRHFGQMDLSQLKNNRQEDIFFNWLGDNMIAYRERWCIPGELLVTTLLLCLIALNTRRSKIRMGRILLALPAAVAVLLIVPGTLVITEWLLSGLLSRHMILGDSKANSYILVGFVLFGSCTGAFVFTWIRKRFEVLEFSIAGLIIADIISWIITLMLPAGSYLLFWPLLMMTIGFLTITLADKADSAGAATLASLAAAAITILLFAPLVYLLYIFLTIQLITVAGIGILIGLLFIIAVPFIDTAIPQNRWRAAELVLLSGAVTAFTIGVSLSHYTAQHPRRDSAIYSMNADNQNAAWISYDRSLDRWTTQLFSNLKPELRSMPDYLAGSERMVLSAPAVPLNLAPPIAEIATDEKRGDIRAIRMNVRPQRNASAMRLVFFKDVQVLSVTIGARKISTAQNSPPLTISLLGVGTRGVDLELEIRAPAKISFWLMDQSDGLPKQIPPRPDDIMATGASDMTFICRKYSL